MDVEDICARRKRSDKRMDYTAVCRRIITTRDTGSGDWYTTSQYNRTLGFRFVSGTLAAYTSNSGITWRKSADDPFALPCGAEQNFTSSKCTTANNRAYTWNFINDRLAEVVVTPDWMAIYKVYNDEGIARHPEVVPAFNDEIDFLTRTYGPPTTVEKVPYQNAFGAHWERANVVWTEPDGTRITAMERSGFDQEGQLALVAFQLPEALKKNPQTNPKRNPYEH
jgi:hypothetical protein